MNIIWTKDTRSYLMYKRTTGYIVIQFSELILIPVLPWIREFRSGFLFCFDINCRTTHVLPRVYSLFVYTLFANDTRKKPTLQLPN